MQDHVSVASGLFCLENGQSAIDNKLHFHVPVRKVHSRVVSWMQDGGLSCAQEKAYLLAPSQLPKMAEIAKRTKPQITFKFLQQQMADAFPIKNLKPKTVTYLAVTQNDWL